MGDFGGRYRRVKLLGAGGMGEVWLALDEQLADRQVAIKIMRSHMLSDQEGQLRFQREMQLASQMSHPNIMLVLTSGTDQGVPFMVMEYLEGHDLRKVPHGLDADDVARIGRETCAALSYAHDQGVVHRDITPGNLFLCSNGLVKVTDFGIAKALTGSKITQSGTLVGTFPYMAPEQWLGEPATFSIDVWATGCVLYLLLSGRLPRDYSTAAEYVAAAVRSEQAAPPAGTSDVPSWLADAVVAMLEPDPRSRPTAAECVGLLSGSATDPGSNPKHSPPRPPAPRKVEYQPALGSGADPARAMRLLTDAEQMASAIGAAQALARVAAVLASVDAAHAARVLDDALHQRSGSLNAHLITSAAGDIGAVLTRMDALPARRLLAEMEKVLQLAEAKTYSRRQLAGLVATVDSGWAERVAHAEPDMAYRAAALDLACGVVANSDISRAEQIALTIPDSARPRALGSQLKQAIPGGKRQRASAARRGPELPRYSPGFHKARALAHLAVTAAGGSDVPATPRLSAPPQFAPTVTNGQQGGRAPIRADDAQRLLTEAGHAASRLPEPGDDRAHASRWR
jgi:Protein kinase domain